MLRTTALIMLAAMLLVSCTSDEPERPNEATTVPGEVEVSAPDGFTVHRGGNYGFAFPFDWTPVPGGGTYAAGAEIEVVGPSGDSGLPAMISLYREEGFVGNFDRYQFTFNGEAATALPDRTVIRDEPMTVPQSVEARLIESEYTLQGVPGLVAQPSDKQSDKDSDKKDDDTPSVVIRQVDVLVLTDEGVTINLRTSAPSEDFDDYSEIFTTVVSSLRVPPPVVGDA